MLKLNGAFVVITTSSRRTELIALPSAASEGPRDERSSALTLSQIAQRRMRAASPGRADDAKPPWILFSLRRSPVIRRASVGVW